MTPEEYQKLVELGYIEPNTSTERVYGPVNNAAASAPPPPGPITVSSPGPVASDPFATGAQSAGISAPPPPVPGVSQMPSLPPMGNVDLGALSSGHGSLISGPGRVANPGTLDEGIAAANAGRSIPGAPSRAPNPLPPGSLVTDAGSGPSTVSVPVVRRPASGPPPAAPGPPQHRPGLSTYENPYGGTENPYGGPNIPKQTPAAQKAQTATEEYLASLADQRKAADELGIAKMNAAEQTSQAERAKADALSAGRLEAATKAQADLAASQKRMQAAQLDADRSDVESKQRAMAIASMKVDPDRYWANRNTGQKIMAGIGLLFSGIGSGLTGKSNMAMDVIQAGINRDIDAQKHDIENAKDSAKMLDEISRRKFGRALSQAELDAHTRMDGYNFAMSQVDAQAAAYDNPIIAGKAEMLKAQIQSEIDKTKAGLALQRYEVRTAAEMAAAKAAQKGDNSAALAKEYRSYVVKFQEEGDSLQTAQARAIAVMGGPGVFKVELPALTGKPSRGGKGKEGLGATEREQLRSYDSALDNLYKIRAMIKEGGEISRPRTAKGESLVAGAKNALARAETGGHRAPSPDEIKILDQQLPSDPNAWQFSSKELERIETTIRQVESARKRVAESGSGVIESPPDSSGGDEKPKEPDVGFTPSSQ